MEVNVNTENIEEGGDGNYDVRTKVNLAAKLGLETSNENQEKKTE